MKTTYEGFDLIERKASATVDICQVNGPFWFSVPSIRAARIAVNCINNPFEQLRNETMSAALLRARYSTKIGEGISLVDENGRHSGNHWLRIRKRADGTIWVRVPQCFGYEVAA